MVPSLWVCRLNRSRNGAVFVVLGVFTKGCDAMPNEKNLVPNHERTPSERRKNAKKAGIASGKARKQRKTLCDELLALLSDKDTQEKMSIALIKKAQKGDVKAFLAIRDTIGEKPVDKVIMAEVDASVVEEVEAMVKKHVEP